MSASTFFKVPDWLRESLADPFRRYLIIFSLAVLALDTGIGQRYAKYCRIIGGLVLIVLGGVMVFCPELLR